MQSRDDNLTQSVSNPSNDWASDEVLKLYELNDKLIAMIENYVSFSTCLIDDIIPPVALEKLLRKYNLSTKSIIISVLISSMSLFVLISFLIVGMSVFTKQDGFSAGITSGLSIIIAGVSVNFRSMMETVGSDTDVNLLVSTVIAEYRKSAASMGISLDDKLEDAL